MKGLQKLQDNTKYGTPRLEQALGKEGANGLLNELYEAQRRGSRLVLLCPLMALRPDSRRSCQTGYVPTCRRNCGRLHVEDSKMVAESIAESIADGRIVLRLDPREANVVLWNASSLVLIFRAPRV